MTRPLGPSELTAARLGSSGREGGHHLTLWAPPLYDESERSLRPLNWQGQVQGGGAGQRGGGSQTGARFQALAQLCLTPRGALHSLSRLKRGCLSVLAFGCFLGGGQGVRQSELVNHGTAALGGQEPVHNGSRVVGQSFKFQRSWDGGTSRGKEEPGGLDSHLQCAFRPHPCSPEERESLLVLPQRRCLLPRELSLGWNLSQHSCLWW